MACTWIVVSQSETCLCCYIYSSKSGWLSRNDMARLRSISSTKSLSVAWGSRRSGRREQSRAICCRLECRTENWHSSTGQQQRASCGKVDNRLRLIRRTTIGREQRLSDTIAQACSQHSSHRIEGVCKQLSRFHRTTSREHLRFECGERTNINLVLCSRTPAYKMRAVALPVSLRSS